jgi:transposase InsO family protein
MSRVELIPKFNIVKGSKCQSFVQAKQPWKPLKSLEVKRNLAPLDLVHSDLCEMNGLLTRGGKRYFMTFIDDASLFCYIFLLKSKDEALHYFKIYKAEVENKLERKIKWLRDDRGGEYTSNDFSSQLCAEHGIIHEVTPPYSPQSNGVAERKNWTLTDVINVMLDSAGMPYEWWGGAIITTNFVLNRVVTKNREVTPYEGWNGWKPNVGCSDYQFRWDIV